MIGYFRKRCLLFVAVLCLSLSTHTNTASGQSAVYEIDVGQIHMENNVMCIGKLASVLLLTNLRDLQVNTGFNTTDAISSLLPRLAGGGDIDCYIFELKFAPIYPLEIIDTVEFGAGDWQGVTSPRYFVKSVVTAFDGQLFSRETLGDDVYTMANDFIVKKPPR